MAVALSFCALATAMTTGSNPMAIMINVLQCASADTLQDDRDLHSSFLEAYAALTHVVP